MAVRELIHDGYRAANGNTRAPDKKDGFQQLRRPAFPILEQIAQRFVTSGKV